MSRDTLRRVGRNRLVRLLPILAIAGLLATLSPTSSTALEPTELDGSTVYLINAHTGRFLDADADTGAVGQSRVPAIDDQWIMVEESPGVFSFENRGRGRLLDADGPFTDYDVNLSNNVGTDSSWTLTPVGNNAYEVVNVEYGLVLTGAGVNGDFDVALGDATGAPETHWYVGFARLTADRLDSATVLLANDATGLFLDADRNTKKVNQSKAPRIDDFWRVEADSSFFTFRNVGIDRLMHGGDDVDILGEGGIDTKWELRQRSNGTYEIRNAEVGLWLDADNASNDFNVDLSVQVADAEANWHIIVIDSEQDCIGDAFETIDDFLGCIDADDAFVHLQALQAIADRNGGIRPSGTPGYDESAEYVVSVLEELGLEIERQVFDFSLYTPISESLTINGEEKVLIDDFIPMTFSESGEVLDAVITPVDLDLGLDNASTSGCEPEDFDGLDFSAENDIALIQRGACAFSTKALNAQAAGAEGVVIFNQGNSEDRTDTIFGTLGSGVVGTIAIPVLGTSTQVGLDILEDAVVSMAVEATTETSTTENILADLPGVNPDNVVMAGAHLDSVPQGPGVQDNGSGSAALLAIAEVLANNDSYVPQNTLRFAWWGAEEFGLIGSNEYIFNPEFGLTLEEYEAIALYLNFDMIGSPNYTFMVYDADQTSFTAPVPIPPGSEALEDLFEAYYTIESIPYDDAEFSGRSDYQAFINVGIPASGLFTGAEGIKSMNQMAIWGGTFGEQYDQCYHEACDTIDNVSYEAMETNTDAVAYSIFLMAASTEVVNGVPGVSVKGITPDEIELDGSQGTFLNNGAGGNAGGNGGGGLDPHLHEYDATRD